MHFQSAPLATSALLFLLVCTSGFAQEETTTHTAHDESSTSESSVTTNSSPSNSTDSSTPATNTTGLPYGSQCAKNDDCDATAGLMCVKDECDCARKTEMTYSKATNSCIVLESHSCDSIPNMKADNFNCTKHATCVSNGENKPKTCVCNKGYSVDGYKNCKADFETNCNNDGEPCNPLAVLKCHIADGEIIGKCGCYTPAENIYENGKCIALAGATCSYGDSSRYPLTCTPHAVCESENLTDAQNTTGICKCTHGTVKLETSSRCGAKSNVPRVSGNTAVVIFMLGVVATIFKN